MGITYSSNPAQQRRVALWEVWYVVLEKLASYLNTSTWSPGLQLDALLFLHCDFLKKLNKLWIIFST